MAPSRLTRPPRVAAQRRRLRLSQAQLATTVGITQGALSHIEAGGHTPSVLLAVRIATALGVAVETLWRAHNRPASPTTGPQRRLRRPPQMGSALHGHARKNQGLSKR